MNASATQAWDYLTAAVSVLAKWFVISLLAQLALTVTLVGLLAGPGLVSAGFASLGVPPAVTLPISLVTFVAGVVGFGALVSRVDPVFGFTTGLLASD